MEEMEAVSLLMVIVVLPTPVAETDNPATPADVPSMLFVWLVSDAAVIDGILKIVSLCSVPPDKPVAARKFPPGHILHGEMPTSPVVLFVSSKRLFTES